MSELILASKSAARGAILRAAGLKFVQVDSGLDEDQVKTRLLAENATPYEIALGLAEEKAKRVSEQTEHLVLGADQTLDLGGDLIDKARSMEEAKARLWSMRGRAHYLRSALALCQNGQILWSDVFSARLLVREFSEAWLETYLEKSGDIILSSVGCYQIESIGIQLFEAVEGDHYTIMGLPLLPLLDELRHLEIIGS